jgi:ubiquinone/menaquinone biosynthesis C-methylase UbiE
MTSAAPPTTPHRSDRFDRYLLGDSPAEVEHLIVQAEIYAPESEQLLDLIGVEQGATAIDVGCGALGVLHLLRGRVGPHGRVMGLDREPGLLAMAEQLASARGLEVELVQSDASSTGLPSEMFDLVHARTVLVNVSNPAAIVAEMVRVAKPGGVIALQEPDCSCWVCDPPHPAWEPMRDAVRDAFRRNGKDAELGRRAGRLLREAGLDHVHVRATARVTQPGDYYQTFLLTMTALVKAQILARRHQLNADQLDSYTAALTDHLNTPGTLTCQPTMWQAWGTKP